MVQVPKKILVVCIIISPENCLTIYLPILDPKVNGYALSNVKTPEPTNGVIVAVNTEDDCTKKVTIAPIKIMRYLKRKKDFRHIINKTSKRCTYPVSQGT